MRLPRVHFRLRTLMIAVAVAALVMFLVVVPGFQTRQQRCMRLANNAKVDTQFCQAEHEYILSILGAVQQRIRKLPADSPDHTLLAEAEREYRGNAAKSLRAVQAAKARELSFQRLVYRIWERVPPVR